MSEYNVVLVVSGRATCSVEADSQEEADRKAREMFANDGVELEIVDVSVEHMEDADGNHLYY